MCLAEGRAPEEDLEAHLLFVLYELGEDVCGVLISKENSTQDFVHTISQIRKKGVEITVRLSPDGETRYFSALTGVQYFSLLNFINLLNAYFKVV